MHRQRYEDAVILASSWPYKKRYMKSEGHRWVRCPSLVSNRVGSANNLLSAYDVDAVLHLLYASALEVVDRA